MSKKDFEQIQKKTQSNCQNFLQIRFHLAWKIWSFTETISIEFATFTKWYLLLGKRKKIVEIYLFPSQIFRRHVNCFNFSQYLSRMERMSNFKWKLNQKRKSIHTYELSKSIVCICEDIVRRRNGKNAVGYQIFSHIILCNVINWCRYIFMLACIKPFFLVAAAAVNFNVGSNFM